MTMSCYNKLFINEIKRIYNGDNLRTAINRSVMKASILGVVTSIQKFSRKTIYSVDDGTDVLDCILWHNESESMKNISKLRMELDSGSGVINKDMKDTCHLLLSKVEVKEDYIEYNHGEIICCLGVVKVIKGKLLLNIYHHYKVQDVDAETLWILSVLSCHEKRDTFKWSFG